MNAEAVETRQHDLACGRSARQGAPTGLDLRIKRTVAGVSQTAIARRMGVARQRVGQVEGMLRPPRRLVDRYLEALEAVAAER